MGFDQLLPAPFLFNSLKHHRETVLNFIEKARDNRISKNEANAAMNKIGNSMIDFYYGELPPEVIANEIKESLIAQNYYNEKTYLDLIQSKPKKCNTIILSDGSGWMLLFGRSHGKYIHIHPCRGSEHTIRTCAIALKTAIVLKVFFKEALSGSELVPLVNKARLHYLDESPIKNELYTKGLKRILKHL